MYTVNSGACIIDGTLHKDINNINCWRLPKGLILTDTTNAMNDHGQAIEIRRWTDGDGVGRITEILHSSYAQLAELGFRYHATWQGEDVTETRLKSGLSYIAIKNDLIVGTITLRMPPDVSGCSWYDRGDVASFGQFGVEPACQRNGIGSLLLQTVETEAKNHGVLNIALDTAEGAAHLIEIYKSRGYEFVGHADWAITNYRSVILNKSLHAA